jgi:hypothetical protein
MLFPVAEVLLSGKYETHACDMAKKISKNSSIEIAQQDKRGHG